MRRACASQRLSAGRRLRLLKLTLACLILAGGGLAFVSLRATKAADGGGQGERRIGREVAVPRHLKDDQEFQQTAAELFAHGRLLFNAIWTEQEGGGRPLSKGTGRPLADPSRPLTGARAFNRISAPDANSCAGCHNAPHGISGGGGDFVTNVFVLGQRFDAVTFDPSDTLPTRGTADEAGRPASLQTIANLRSTTGMFGAGYLEMLARQMTEELQRTREGIRMGETKDLAAKGVRFGKLTLTKAGLWDTSQVEGLPRPSLISSDSHHPPSTSPSSTGKSPGLRS
ncbi:MAG: hypothetical protein ABW208_27740 [Pyrinomonadaceae bacterium]